MIFLKPTIVRSTTEGREITSERYDYLRGEQSNIAPAERWFWKDPTGSRVAAAAGTMPGTPQANADWPSPNPATADSTRRARAIPYAFSRAHGVLAWRTEGDAVVVLLRPTRRSKASPS